MRLGEIHPRTLVHLPSNVSVFSFPYQANPTPTTHTPSREACRPIVGKVLPLICTLLKVLTIDTVLLRLH